MSQRTLLETAIDLLARMVDRADAELADLITADLKPSDEMQSLTEEARTLVAQARTDTKVKS
jgi:hypothetical protein